MPPLKIISGVRNVNKTQSVSYWPIYVLTKKIPLHIDGGSCPAFDRTENKNKESNSLTTFEATLDKESLQKPELVIDGDLQPPGKYIFTLMTAKGTQKSEANATVSILPQHLPTIQVLTLESQVPPYKKFVATALVSGYEGTCVWWENIGKEKL